MNTSNRLYKRHRFPAEIIQYAVWLYFKFNLSHRDIEDLLAKRGIQVSYEAIRLWCNKFGPKYAMKLRKKHQGYGDTFFLDEVFIKINGKQHYLWRAVDQDGEVSACETSPKPAVTVTVFVKYFCLVLVGVVTLINDTDTELSSTLCS